MMLKTTILAASIAALLTGCAPKQTARNCDTSVEMANQFVERALKLRPDLAVYPARTDTNDALYWLACRDGLRNGKANNADHLAALHDFISEAAQQPELTVEDGRYLVGDMAMFLAYRYGFEAANS
ncbi:hypothetical protein SB5439_05128 [Klebsiella variicola]|nr:hypothetical protein SB5439_05128 [Klebsiella variicola]